MNLQSTQTIAAVAMHALLCYMHCTSPPDFAKEIFGEDSHPSYLDGKAEAFNSSPRHAIGRLDTPLFKKLVKIALERHGDSSQQSLGFESAE